MGNFGENGRMPRFETAPGDLSALLHPEVKGLDETRNVESLEKAET